MGFSLHHSGPLQSLDGHRGPVTSEMPPAVRQPHGAECMPDASISPRGHEFPGACCAMERGRALASGTVVGGEWRIERMLGAGGFGVTYEAHHKRERSRIALKEYFPVGCGTRDEGSSTVRP